MTSHFFAPYVLRPSRLIWNTLMDNIFINSVEYLSHSGDLTIQIVDHLFQFVLLEGFFKDILPKKIKLYERNFKNFVDREFIEALCNINWDEILLIHENDPNISLNNLHCHINFILDEFAPFKKLSKKELKLKSKPWINNLILIEINKCDMLLHKYSKMKYRDNETAKSIYDEYKIIRNKVTKLKRDGRVEYYHRFFDENKRKSLAIWKGIRSMVNINSTTRKYIKLLDEKDKNVCDPNKIAELLNKYFASVGNNIDKKIPRSLKHFKEFMTLTASHDGGSQVWLEMFLALPLPFAFK